MTEMRVLDGATARDVVVGRRTAPPAVLLDERCAVAALTPRALVALKPV